MAALPSNVAGGTDFAQGGARVATNSSSTPPIELDPKLASAELPTEIRLTNGFVMHKSAVTRWEPNSVLVSYQGGIVVVRFANIVPEQRAIFEARKEEALARQAKEDAKGSVGQDNAAKEEQARQAAAVRRGDHLLRPPRRRRYR